MKIKNIYSLLEIGKRKNLEDYIFPHLNKATVNDKIFIVCDGVGGENKGEVASKITADTFGEFLNRSAESITENYLQLAFNKVQQNFKNYIQLHPEATKMSTTLTLAVIKDDSVLVAWCGDSKIYHIRSGKILWKSKDHSLVQHLIDIGEINTEESKNHPQRNVIIKSISSNTKHTDIEFKTLNNIKENDYLLLATDGVFEQIDDENLLNILNQKVDNKSLLIYKKCEGYTNDNYSMHLLKFKRKSKDLLIKTIIFIFFTFCIIFSFLYLSTNKEKSSIEDKIKLNDENNTKNVDIPIFKNNEENEKETIETKSIPVVKKIEPIDKMTKNKEDNSISNKSISTDENKKDKKKLIEPANDSVVKINSDSVKIKN